MGVMQDLYDAEINVETTSFFDDGWFVKIGDRQNGFIAQDRCNSWEDVEEWLVSRAVALFPQSDFAAKYRRPGRPHLTLVEEKPQH